MRESSRFNNLFTVLNLGIVVFVTVAGLSKANTSNWSLPAEESAGRGGFFPYGWAGTMKGAATCFYGFVGFDAIATTGEEARDPQRAIPRAILLSLAAVALAYAGVSSALTLMVPFHLQVGMIGDHV